MTKVFALKSSRENYDERFASRVLGAERNVYGDVGATAREASMTNSRGRADAGRPGGDEHDWATMSSCCGTTFALDHFYVMGDRESPSRHLVGIAYTTPVHSPPPYYVHDPGRHCGTGATARGLRKSADLCDGPTIHGIGPAIEIRQAVDRGHVGESGRCGIERRRAGDMPSILRVSDRAVTVWSGLHVGWG